MKLYILTLLIIFSIFEQTQAQKIDKKAFKDAKFIRLYVTDSSKREALIRFAKFIDNTGFTACIPEKTKDKENNQKKLNTGIIKPNVNLKQTDGSSLVGDTIKTNFATLYDAMWGDFVARLTFYPETDDKDNLYIVITGFVSNSNFGGNFNNLQMQKGGNANWAQKALFRQVNKHIEEYTNVTLKLYSDK